MRGILFACCLLMVLPRAAAAQSWIGTPEIRGTTVVDSGDAHLRLPPGQWELIGESGGGGGSTSSPGHAKLLLQTDGGKFAALVLVSASAGAPAGFRAKWLVPNDCGRGGAEVQFIEDRNIDNNRGSFDCLAVGFARLSTEPDSPLWGPLESRSQALGGHSASLVVVRYHQSSRSLLAVITVMVLIDPAAPGFKHLLDDALRGVQRRPGVERGKTAELVANWARGYRTTVADALP